MLWILGILCLLLLTAGVCACLNRKRQRPSYETRWDLASLGGSYSGVLTTLAAVGVATTVFVAQLRIGSGAPAYSSVIGLFLIAFIMLIGTTVTLATFRSATTDPRDRDSVMARRVMFVLSVLCFYLGVSLTLLGLQPLLISIRLNDVAEVFSWVLLFVLFAGATRVCSWSTSLLGATNGTSSLGPAAAMGLAVCYHQWLVPRFPWLWPSWNPAISLSIVVLAMASAVFFVETLMIRMHGTHQVHETLHRLGPRLVPQVSLAGASAITMVWLALVFP